MTALKAEIFCLIVFFTSGIESELRHDTENVCPQNENFEVTVIDKVYKPVTVTVKKGCSGLRKLLSCKKRIKKMKLVEEPRVVQKSRPVLKCCKGYREQGGIDTKCVPECPTGCVLGKCTAPDKCICTSGVDGGTCGKRSVVTTDTPKTMAQRNPTTEISTQEISQATEKSTTPMFEISEMTSTDLVTQSTTEATVRMTEEVSDETSTTELYGIEDEKETSTRKFRNTKMSLAAEDVLNPTASAKMSEEETANKLWTNAKTALESEGAGEPVKVSKNPQVYYSTSILYVTAAVVGFLLVVGWLVTVILQRKIRGSKMEKQGMLYLKEQVGSLADNLSWVDDRSESPIKARDAEPNNLNSVLVDLPVHDQGLVTLFDQKAGLLEKAV